jgi:hypothetical protein
MKHIIQKQILQLTIGPGLEAFGVQHAASRFYRDVLIPMLERAFDELAGDGDVFRMDRLVVDLGILREGQLLRAFPEQELYELLKTQLQQLLREEGEGVKRIPGRASILEQWWFYMEKGRLPWNADSIEVEGYRLLLEILSVDYGAVTRLKLALENQPAFRKRLSRQHPDEFLETLVGIVLGERQEALSRRVQECCAMARRLDGIYRDIKPSDENLAAGLRRWIAEHSLFLAQPAMGRKAMVWELLLQSSARQPAELKAGGAVALLASWLSADARLRRLLRKEWPDSPLLRPDSPPLQPDLLLPQPESRPLRPDSPPPRHSAEALAAAHPLKPAPEGDQEAGGPAQANAEPGRAGAEDVSEERIVRNGEDRSAKQKASEAAEGQGLAPAGQEQQDIAGFDRREVDAEGLFGNYAGLILLHPFLTTFFSRCDLMEGGRFRDAAARQQAVFLLYYLATGEKEGPEYEMLFPKLFCGCALDESLPSRLELPETFYAEADELLQMVLQRWEKLKNTSVNGLREGFLRRMGKLVNRQNRLVLVVEVSAIDVLLDYLPWNLSLVKLPWLKELLYIEWR